MNPSNVHASLFNAQLPDFISLDEIDFTQIDLVISGLPHNNLHNIINNIPNKCKVIDLSADFRFSDVNIYNQYYETSHNSSELLSETAYGLSEIFRDV